MSRPLLALAVAVAAFAFQQTAVVPALPTIEADLAASRAWTAWLLTGYLVAASVATPLLGKLGDRHGRRRVLIWCMAAFFAGSVGAAAAPTIEVLIACRLLQGAGGAVFPLAIALGHDADPLRSSAGAMTGAFGLGVGLGFGLAGPLVELASWRWMFVASALAIAISGGLVLRWVSTAGERGSAPVDVPGAVLLSIGLGSLLLALTESGGPAVAFAVVAAGTLGVFVRRERRLENPLLGVAVMGDRTVLALNATGFLLGTVMFGALLLVPYLLQDELGASPLEVGLFLLPLAAAQVVSGPLAAPLARRSSSRAVLVGGVALAAGSAVILAAAPPGVPLVIGAMTMLGAGIGAAIGISTALVTAAVPITETGVAHAVNAVMRRVGGSVGGQAGAAVLAAGGGFRGAFTLCAVAGVAGAIVAMRA